MSQTLSVGSIDGTECCLNRLKTCSVCADNEVTMAPESTAQRAQAPQDEFWVEADESAEKKLSEIARGLTSANRYETFADVLISHLARILGGGLRTVW